MLVTADERNNGGFVWYLAWNARSATTWRSYWFWKFRYWVARYLERVAPRAGRDLFFKQQVRRFAASLGESIPPTEVPGFKDIIRTLRQSGYELKALKSERGVGAAMAKDVRVLADYIAASETFAEAFLHYAASMYLTLDPEDRALTRLESSGGVWSRISRDPVASRVLVQVLGGVATAVVVTLVVHYLR